MNVLITGAAGFLGRRLAQDLLEQNVGKLVLLDREKPVGFGDPRVVALGCDISRVDEVAAAIEGDIDTVFHLAAVVSGEAEADFDLGMRVNVEGSRLLLEACRRKCNRPRVVFTSSVAVFGPSADTEVDDSTAVDPRSSYGMEKAVAELLLKDYTRRGFVDGVALRLPTISVRPGRPNKAASSFASGIIREPLAGLEAVCPVPPETRLWLLSPKAAIANLVRASQIELPHADRGRVINLPGISVSVGEMVDALQRIAGPEVSGRVRWVRDASIEAIVASWPSRWDVSRALSLGFENGGDLEAIIRGHMEERVHSGR
jgi:nucleoside-diphosphate-sugar epimerase